MFDQHRHNRKKNAGHDDKIVDLVLKGYKKDQSKNQDHVVDQWSSSDSETLNDSTLTESSLPTDNSGLLQELLYTHKNKNKNSSEVTLPAKAFDSDSSSTSSIGQVLGDKRDTDEGHAITEILEDDVPISCRKPYRKVTKGLGRRGEMKEKSILSSIGLGRLTKLGRINAARVLVGNVTINKDLATSNRCVM